MIPCISQWSLNPEAAFSAQLDEVCAAGFSGLELTIGEHGALHLASTVEECRALRTAIDARGLVCETVACGLAWSLNPVSDDAEVRARSLAAHRAALERTAALGCRTLLVVPGVVGSPIAPSERVRTVDAEVRARAFIEALIPHAERLQVEIGVENVWNGFLYAPTAMRDFLDACASPWVGAYFDVGNVLGWHQDPVDWIQTLGRRIRRVHVKDFRHEFGFSGRYAFCDLGTGDVRWTEVMAALRAIGYERTVVAEMMPWRPDLAAVTATALTHILGDHA